MAKDVIILAGIPASGKSTSMGRLLPGKRRQKKHLKIAGRRGCYYQHSSGMFIYSGKKVRELPDGALVIHWTLPSSRTESKGLPGNLAAVAKIKHRIEEVQLLICSYRCYLSRYWRSSDRRKVQFRHATDPEQILVNYEKFRDGCEALGLETCILDTSKPGKLVYAEKSFREILSKGMPLERGAAIAIRLLDWAGIKKVV